MFLVGVVFVLVGTANAALTNYGDGMLYDNANKQYWIADLTVLVNMTYDQQVQYIADEFNDPIGRYVGGAWGEWHMADYSEMLGLWQHGGQPLRENFIGTGTEDVFGSEVIAGKISDWPPGITTGDHCYMWVWKNEYGEWIPVEFTIGISDSIQKDWLGAWVSADVAVPVPSTMILLGSGVIALAGFRRKRKKDIGSSFLTGSVGHRMIRDLLTFIQTAFLSRCFRMIPAG